MPKAAFLAISILACTASAAPAPSFAAEEVLLPSLPLAHGADPTAGLSGPDRDAFVTSAVTACGKRMAAEYVSKDTVAEYCTCAAEGLASMISAHEAEALSSPEGTLERMRLELQSRAAAAGAVCSERIRSEQNNSA